MDDPSGISFKATLEKFKTFARECAEEAYRTAVKVRKHAILRGNSNNDVQRLDNSSCSKAVDVSSFPCFGSTSGVEGAVRDEVCPEEKEENILDIITDKSSITLEKLQDASKTIQEISIEAVKIVEEVIANCANISKESIEIITKTGVERGDSIAKLDVEQTENIGLTITNIINNMVDIDKGNNDFSVNPENSAPNNLLPRITTESSSRKIAETFEVVLEFDVSCNDDNVAKYSFENSDSQTPLHSPINILKNSHLSYTTFRDPLEDLNKDRNIVCEYEDLKITTKCVFDVANDKFSSPKNNLRCTPPDSLMNLLEKSVLSSTTAGSCEKFSKSCKCVNDKSLNNDSNKCVSDISVNVDSSSKPGNPPDASMNSIKKSDVAYAVVEDHSKVVDKSSGLMRKEGSDISAKDRVDDSQCLEEIFPPASLMNMLKKSDVTCTIVGDPSDDFAEACKIVCNHEESSQLDARKCEHACLAVNRLREEVLKTAQDMSNKEEYEKDEKRSTY